ncbi:unnamed protein product [Rotaria sp. Silwood1]|nr:unnamed protein product [Rotaria sp. Silwood1]
MARKKSCNTNATQETENVNKKNYVQNKNFPRKIPNNSNTISSFLLVGTPQEEGKTTNDENIHSLIQEADSKEKEMDKLIFCDISNKNDELDVSPEHANTVIYDLTSPRVIVGQKRHIEESSDSVVEGNNTDELIRLKKKCLEIEKRVEVLEMTWMPCPEHLDTVQNIFNGIIEDINNDRVVMNNNNKMSDSNNGLNIDSEILFALKKDSSTATARSILKYLYPHPPVNFKLFDVDSALVADIVRYSKECHPDDASTTARIRHAMSNYFALITYRKKRKSIISNTTIQNQ